MGYVSVMLGWPAPGRSAIGPSPTRFWSSSRISGGLVESQAASSIKAYENMPKLRMR